MSFRSDSLSYDISLMNEYIANKSKKPNKTNLESYSYKKEVDDMVLERLIQCFDECNASLNDDKNLLEITIFDVIYEMYYEMSTAYSQTDKDSLMYMYGECLVELSDIEKFFVSNRKG